MRILVLATLLWLQICSPLAWAKCEKGFNGESLPGLDSRFQWFFNTSNPIKRGHLQELLTAHSISFLDNDLDEISAAHIDVVVQKASQFNSPHRRIIVEDTALYVEGAEFGTNIRWEVSRLPEFIGKKAKWVSLVAYRDGNEVKIFRSVIHGVLGEKIPGKEGIEAFMRLVGTDGSLHGVDQPPSVSATEKLLKSEVYAVRPAIDQWDGEWQHQKKAS